VLDTPLSRPPSGFQSAEDASASPHLAFIRGPACFGTIWTGRHLGWVRKQEFAHEKQQRVLTDYVSDRGIRNQKTVTAIARELTGSTMEDRRVCSPI
jgi:hypothetical protein